MSSVHERRRTGALRVPASLSLVVVLASTVSAGCETSSLTREDLGDGCAQFRAPDAAVTQIECRIDGGCVRYWSPDGAFRQMICADPRDWECRTVTEADGAVETIC